MTYLSEPLLTYELDRVSFRPDGRGSYIHALSSEARSQLDPQWLAGLSPAPTLLDIAENGDDTISLTRPGRATSETIDLRDQQSLQAVIGQLPQPVYLDFTGFTHRAWAPLVRAAVVLGIRELFLIYVEPGSYTRSTTPSPGQIFDLSETGAGIAPLPGFASLARRTRQVSQCFVPMLGFEGARLGLLLTESDPSSDKIVPVLGLPGFRIEYPFMAYLGNRDHFEESFLHRKVRVAKANCPFDAFQLLQRILTDFPKDLIQIAPIGTKPHSLGAVLFAIARPGRVELMYDNPRRKDKRTTGEARVCLYDVGTFLQSDLFQGVGRYA